MYKDFKKYGHTACILRSAVIIDYVLYNIEQVVATVQINYY